MKRFLVGALLLCFAASPALAGGKAWALGDFQGSGASVAQPLNLAQFPSPAPRPAAAPQPAAPQADPVPPPVTQTAPAAPVAVPTSTPQTQITTSAPVTSETTISVGTIMGEILKAVAALAATAIGTVGSALLYRLLQGVGFSMQEAQRKRVQELIETGLASAVSRYGDSLTGKINVNVKNKAIADAIRYAQDHGAATFKQLGLDSRAQSTIDALAARAEAALLDPNTPVSVTPTETVDQQVARLVNERLAPKQETADEKVARLVDEAIAKIKTGPGMSNPSGGVFGGVSSSIPTQ